MSAKKQLEKLLSKKKQAIDTIVRIGRFISSHKDDPSNETKIEQFLVRKDILQDNYEKLQNIQIEILCLDENYDDSIDDLENLYVDVIVSIKECLPKPNLPNIGSNLACNMSQPQVQPVSSQGSLVSAAKLPPIEIPTFDGKNLTNFKSFIDIFTAVVDKNQQLKDVEKLFYLKTYLKCEALSLINNLPLINSSYQEALTILNNRFNNETMIVNSHIFSILDIPNIQKGTAYALRDFVSRIKQQIGALKNLGQPVDSWDMMLVCILSRKVDQFTNRAYQIDRDSSKLPTLNDFLAYLENRAIALEASSSVSETNRSKDKVYGLLAKHSTVKCPFCLIAGHKLYNCIKFKSTLVKDRISFINKHNYCTLCLNNHSGKCKMLFRCGTCKRDHNTLLHLDKQPPEDKPIEKKVMHFNLQHENVLLPTVRVRIKSSNGKYVYARGLVDTGSQISLVTSTLIKKLNLKTFDNSLNIIGISEIKSTSNKSVNLNIESLFYNYSKNIKCAVVDTITNDLPSINFDISTFEIPKGIQLSDDNFNCSGQIDFLLGANVAFEIFLSHKFESANVYFQDTLFGYIVSGSIPANVACNFVALHVTYSDIDKTISQFWETEKVPEIFPEYPCEQEACEHSFQGSLEVVDNQYQVKLPLKEIYPNLGDSFSVAIKRLENLEKRFKANPELFLQYKSFIDDYLNLNHAKIVNYNSEELNSGSIYFMAHHPVIREDKKTTKLRVVFDGSMKSKDKKCINDFLYNGANVQNELFDILILFRTYKFVVSTDIKQMYRMVLINPKHRPFQNILWREPHGPLQYIQLQTVTYGLKSSSFLATRCLVELAQTEGDKFPLAAQALLNNTYVDDILTGSDTIEDTIKLKDELISLLNLRSFSLHKWCTNEPKILSDVPKEKQNFDEIDMSKNNFTTKALGLSYDTTSDNFKLSTPEIINTNECVTKRQVLSFISKFYDPLGLAGPILVAAKVIMQKIWMRKLSWDEILPDNLLEIWKKFMIGFINMPTLEIPRNLIFTDAIGIELVGFCDSSMIAYGAVIYARTIFPDRVYVNLICSKSRIVPLNKKLTIPRLELNGALLLANLTEKVFLLLQSRIDKVFLYSDSTIVLAWLKSDPLKLNPYVANRILKIQNSTANFKWLYINTKENPADCLSRGLEPQEIHLNKLWFHGPNKLSNIDFYHNEVSIEVPDSLPEEKIIHFIRAQPNSLFKDFSTITKLQRVVAYILRFMHNSRKNAKDRLKGNLSIFELEGALRVIIKYEQNVYFSNDINSLLSNIPVKSSLNSLSPFLDGNGVLRVGGRLQNANISYNQKHPVILPKESNITKLIITKEHLTLLHAGPRQVLSSLNLYYWIINGIRLVKKQLHKCVTCFKFKAKCSSQLMGSLPEKRVCSARIFQNVGVDFCGPFLVKQSRIRKSVSSKAYIALFVCFSVKAIHMELLSDLTTENFLAAFKRFISRRGKPENVFCDNGSTFKGADNKIKQFCKESEKIENYCIDQKIKFNFIPSYSPVFGGLWEAGVKSAKFHIKRVIGSNELIYEQFNTLIIQVEGILNSRPLIALSQDPSDLDYLTPGHFLTGAPITSFPEPDLTEIPQNRLKFWRLCVQMQQHFWKKWYHDYLTQLQSRPKWRNVMPNLKEGMLVILREDNVPSYKWPMARIVKVIPGKDNKVRVVEVKTQKGVYLRSVTKVAVLPIDDTLGN